MREVMPSADQAPVFVVVVAAVGEWFAGRWRGRPRRRGTGEMVSVSAMSWVTS
jgi:hypothetical protein